jgi:dephospho-CoA kinase
MKLLLGIIGEQFSGKDTVADYLVAKHNAFHIRQSHILDEILDVLDLPISRRNEMDLGIALRKTFGTDTVGKAVEKRLRESNQELQVVQGIRFQEEFNIVRRLGGKMIYITAPAETRYQRAMQRQEKADDQTQTFDQFLETEKTEPTEVGIPGLGAKADVKIENNGTLEELYQQIETILHGEEI